MSAEDLPTDFSRIMKVLVTGGTGFIGSHIVKELHKAGHHVRLLVRDRTKAEKIFPTPMYSIDDYYVGCVTDQALVREAVKGCDAVIHTAAVISIKRVEAQRLNVGTVNIAATENMINAALDEGIEKIIYSSSISALFSTDGGDVTATSPLAVVEGEYGKSKVACENYIRALQDQGKPIASIYPGGVIGPDDPGLSETVWGMTTTFGPGILCLSGGFQVIDARDVALATMMILNNGAYPDHYLMPGTFDTWPATIDIFDEVAGKKVRQLKGPGWLYRGLGKVVDVIGNLVPINTPLTYESMLYATTWRRIPLSQNLIDLGFEYRPRKESFHDMVQWMLDNDHIPAEKVPALTKRS
ncbi:MAG: NAD-dependent epimerase/dehydratase family protein [Gammaproteobacteria bacterium]|nr:NAD-dependent epimerase/dehydratase family protein [Gammaproteobacteria bacterium]